MWQKIRGKKERRNETEPVFLVIKKIPIFSGFGKESKSHPLVQM
jgi:hypothetical protein